MKPVKQTPRQAANTAESQRPLQSDLWWGDPHLRGEEDPRHIHQSRQGGPGTHKWSGRRSSPRSLPAQVHDGATRNRGRRVRVGLGCSWLYIMIFCLWRSCVTSPAVISPLLLQSSAKFCLPVFILLFESGLGQEFGWVALYYVLFIYL